ncbi:MAG: hypothetical protein ONB24_13885 [candidate division KSB1 bacterium]|nr:hypothetical protein [candidate division KSB1 bacterium]
MVKGRAHKKIINPEATPASRPVPAFHVVPCVAEVGIGFSS